MRSNLNQHGVCEANSKLKRVSVLVKQQAYLFEVLNWRSRFSLEFLNGNSRLKCESILVNLDNSKQFQLVETAAIKDEVFFRKSGTLIEIIFPASAGKN